MAPRHQLYLGNLDQRVTRRMLYELGIQAGPVVDVSLPPSLSGAGIRGFGFVEYETEETLDYAYRLLEGRVTLFGRLCSVEKSGRPTRSTPGSSRQAPQQQQQQLKPQPEKQKQQALDPMQELDYHQQQQLMQQHAFMQQQLAYTQHALMYQQHAEQPPPPPPLPHW